MGIGISIGIVIGIIFGFGIFRLTLKVPSTTNKPVNKSPYGIDLVIRDDYKKWYYVTKNGTPLHNMQNDREYFITTNIDSVKALINEYERLGGYDFTKW